MRQFKQLHPYEIALVTVILAIHLFAALSDAYNLPNTWFIHDDAYYYFKVAQNISEGQGSTFDGINPTNGYHPLWMVVCIPIFALARYDLILPLRLLLLVMGVLNAGTALLIYRMVKENLSNTVAILASSFWAFNLYIHFVVYKYGLETPLAAFAIALFMYKLSKFERRRPEDVVTGSQLALLAGLAVFVMFSRLDLVFLALIAGIWIIFRGSLIRFLLPLDVVLIFISITTSAAFQSGIKTYNALYARSTIEILFFATAIKLIALFLLGAYNQPGRVSIWLTIRQTVMAMMFSTSMLFFSHLLFSRLDIGRDFPKSAFIIDFVISSVLILALRLAASWFGETRGNDSKYTSSPILEFRTNIRRWVVEAGIYYGILGGLLSLYMLINKLAFGTFTPVSGQIKRWWGTLGNTVYDYPAGNWTAFLGISHKGVYNAWQPATNVFDWLATLIKPLYPGSNTQDERFYIMMAVSAFVALLLLFLSRQHTIDKVSNMAIIPLLAGSAIQTLSYTTTAYGGAKEWYWVGQIVLIVLIGSILLDNIIQPIQKYSLPRKIMPILLTAAGLFLAFRLGGYISTVMVYNYFPPERPYMEVLPYLEKNTPPGSRIGMTGGGNVGYFIVGRTIVNMDGLINSYDYFRAVQNGKAPIFLKDHGLDIVFANTRLMEQPPYYGQFTPFLQSYSTYGGKNLFYLLEIPKY